MSKFTRELPIVITPGEPAGVGPDISVILAQKRLDSPVIFIADPILLADRAALLNLPLDICCVNTIAEAKVTPAGTINVYPVSLACKAIPGVLLPENAAYVINCLDIAATACLQKKAAALITGPAQKSLINQAGIPFLGHTQYLADFTQTKEVVMLFVSDTLKLALVTDHLPLSGVSQAVTEARLSTVLTLVYQTLQQAFDITYPLMHVAGINPHAGENGYLGHEDEKIVIPTLEKYRKKGWKIAGPLGADSIFSIAKNAKSDVVIAMYHDQGLPVFKQQAFGHSVNMTLGLPFIRTSVDHGTGLSLAGTGKAEAGSLDYVLTFTQALAYDASST